MKKLSSPSIGLRLTAWYAAILAITFSLIAVVVWLALRQSILKTVDRDLHARLLVVGAYIDQEVHGPGVSHLVEELSEDAVVTPGATNLRIADQSGHWIYRSPGSENWNEAIPKRADLPPGGLLQTVQINNQRVRVLSARVEVGTAQLALPLNGFEELQNDFLWTIALGMPALLCIASIGGFWMSSRALKPVQQIAEAAKRISANRLSERLPSSGTGDELDRLSQVLNEMLAGLEASFRRIAHFTADASHELRTPVAIMRTTAEVILARTRSVEEHNLAWKSLLAQTERTSQLIDDLLTLARADSGSDEFHFESVDLDEIVGEACTEMQVVAGAKNLQISTELSPRCSVYGDRDALHRALLILLDNAVRAMPGGGVIEVSLTADREFEPKMTCISVKDTGVGITREDLPHIFDRFYRAAKDRSRRTGGTGLGLAIARWIVTQHGGAIDVESSVGVGSTFRVKLPVQDREHAPSDGLSERSTG